MDPALLVALAIVATALAVGLCIVVLALVVRGRRQQRRLEESLADSRRELEAMQHRLDALAAVRPEPRVTSAPEEFVITTAGAGLSLERPASDVPEPAYQPVSARQFASAAVGESLVRLLALGHGVRRAMSAENRNRIGFEMRREVRRSRKQRKQDLKAARRHLRANRVEEAA